MYKDVQIKYPNLEIMHDTGFLNIIPTEFHALFFFLFTPCSVHVTDLSRCVQFTGKWH